jgi:hypothetical protein
VKNGQNGKKSLRRLKPTVGCNASKRRSTRKLKLVRYGSGGRNKQKGGAGCEADTCFMTLYISKKYRLNLHQQL